MKTTIPFTHDEQFLRRFRTKDRVGHLTTDEVEQLRQAADKGDAYARYGYGRWLYYLNPYPEDCTGVESMTASRKRIVSARKRVRRISDAASDRP